MPELTDISVIRALCEKYDFALSKGFGQNFIINPGIPTKIVDASGWTSATASSRSAPASVLTKELAKRAAKVVSIEVDERLPPLLAETMAGVDNFKLVLQDVLKVDLKALIAAGVPGDAGGGVRQPALLHHQPHRHEAAGRPLAHREPDRDGAEGSRRPLGRRARHPGFQCYQLCSELLRHLQADVHRCAGQLLPGPQGHQRRGAGHAHGHPPPAFGHPRRAGGGTCPSALPPNAMQAG